MALEFKLNYKPWRIKCPDCGAVFHEESTPSGWWQLARHWRMAWRRPEMWGAHFKPRKSKTG